MGKERSLRDIAAENASRETRTVSSTGGEKGVKPEKFSLLPWKALGVIAAHFGVGAAKYSSHNWRNGYEWDKSYDALQRHLTAWWEGEDIDEETGSSHLAAAGFHILVLITFAVTHREKYKQHDTRFKEEKPALATGGLVDSTAIRQFVPGGSLGLAPVSSVQFVKPGVDGSFERSLPEEATGYITSAGIVGRLNEV